MRCRDVLRLSSCYIDGELDERRSSAVRGHLRTCADCSTAVGEEAQIRDAASELDANVEPPASLWAHIEQRIAREEIADSARSRLWLLWPRLRAQLPLAGAALAAAIALFFWLANDEVERARDEAAGPRVTVQKTSLQPEPASGTGETHVERAMRQIRKADERYLTAIAELRTVAASERGHWPEEKTAALDARLAEIQAAALDKKRRLAEGAPGDPASRAELYGLYQQEIDLLMDAALGPAPDDFWEER